VLGDEDITKQGQVKPTTVVINTSQNEKTLDVNPLTNSARVPGIQNTTVSTLKQTRRIQLASIVVFVSMFFNWGYQYWLKWTIDWPERGDGAGWDDGSHTNLWDYIVYGEFASEGGIGFAEMLNFFYRFQIWGDVADLAGTVFVLFMMRELMPFVLIGTIVFCWSNRERGDEFFRKVTMFWVGYFTIMTFQLSLIAVEFSEHDYWEFNVLFDCFGFWIAGFVGLLLDPKIIPLPENIYSREETIIPDLNQPGTSIILNETPIMPEEAINYGVFALFCLPLLYHFITVISVMNGGDDDALCLGFTIPIVGLLIGIGVYRLEFLKGFGIHIAYSVGYGFMAYLVAITGIFSEVVDFFLPIFMVAVIVPIRYHLQSKHTQALGATYAIPLTFWIMLFGFVMGWW
tara:strand:+ start:1825 stop:3027 length:1203 start_codon:yes stop_codon:yes gene_type:complete